MTTLKQSLFEQLDQIVLIDSHSHINPYSAASKDLGDLLGYHYYTELAHSSGMPRERIEEPSLSPREKVGRLFGFLGNIDNTIQWSWFLELSNELFGFEGDTIDAGNWESVYELASQKMAQPDWESQVLTMSGVEKVFLTNDFDDTLSGFDTNRYVPCLRTDDLVFHLANPVVRERLQKCTGVVPSSLNQIKDGIEKLFQHFCRNQARACAISLPPWFSPTSQSDDSTVAKVPELAIPDIRLGIGHQSRVGRLRLDFSERRHAWALVVQQYSELHPARFARTHRSDTAKQANRLLQRCLQIRVHPPQVPHVQANIGGGSRR